MISSSEARSCDGSRRYLFPCNRRTLQVILGQNFVKPRCGQRPPRPSCLSNPPRLYSSSVPSVPPRVRRLRALSRPQPLPGAPNQATGPRIVHACMCVRSAFLRTIEDLYASTTVTRGGHHFRAIFQRPRCSSAAQYETAARLQRSGDECRARPCSRRLSPVDDRQGTRVRRPCEPFDTPVSASS